MSNFKGFVEAIGAYLACNCTRHYFFFSLLNELLFFSQAVVVSIDLSKVAGCK